MKFRMLFALLVLFILTSFAEAGIFKRRRQHHFGTGCSTGNCGQTITGTTATGCGAGGCRLGR